MIIQTKPIRFAGRYMQDRKPYRFPGRFGGR
jgi:hypothetical protein